jgi:3-hydroxybutyrate dehydrogenase
MRLPDHTVVITGAAGGIGRAIALAFAAEGAALVLTDASDSVEAVAASVRERDVRAIALRADVTNIGDMERLATCGAEAFGRLDVLVTCAGLGTAALLVDQEPDAWLHVVDVNLGGTYRAIRAVLPHMMRRRAGRIVTISSDLGKMGGYGFVTAYAASKHGVVGLTRALAAEVGGQGYPEITVNAICPGYVRAGMGVAFQMTKAGPRSGEEVFERHYKRLVPIRRMLEAEEIANAAVFLALPTSGGITGQALSVDGGFLAS